MKQLLLITSFMILTPLWSAHAEPWLANRYAQNCSGCHAPGRINRKMKDRRCTLSCQGCHVNPNGGGMRNTYGMWNSERFLRSFHTDLTWNQKLPAPFKKQIYAKKGIKPEKKKEFAQKGPPLVTRKGASYDEEEYKDHTNYKKTARNLTEDLMYITANDPYRLERTRFAYVSGDLRLFYLNVDRGDGGEFIFWPMAMDLGVRLRPFRYHKLSFIYETRAFTSPQGQGSIPMDSLWNNNGIRTRSAYALWDDLPYNSYLQVGFYRPLFGIYNPNHRTLFADYTGLDQYAIYKNIGFGMAPNVPFFMFNVIRRSESGNLPASGEQGFVITGGLRGVTLGLHLVGSYWSTRESSPTTDVRKLMIDLNGGGTWKFLTLNWDYVRIDKTAFNGERDAVSLLSIETKMRFWRENYIMFNYGTANGAVATGTTGLDSGSGSEIAYGYKGYLISGLETEILVQDKENIVEQGATTRESVVSFQMHMYF